MVSGVCGCVVFFFKQKTAYEMRISDWSSDVCSSDLRLQDAGIDWRIYQYGDAGLRAHNMFKYFEQFRNAPAGSQLALRGMPDADEGRFAHDVLNDRLPRSEEHTSELQSLMRISYAVFCLKKKNTNNDISNT